MKIEIKTIPVKIKKERIDLSEYEGILLTTGGILTFCCDSDFEVVCFQDDGRIFCPNQCLPTECSMEELNEAIAQFCDGEIEKFIPKLKITIEEV